MKTHLGWIMVSGLVVAAGLSAQPDPGPKKETLEALARAFLDLMAKEDYAAASKNFDAAMKKALPVDKLKEGWKEFIDAVGPFKKQGKVRFERVQKYDVVTVTLHLAKADIDVRVVFDKDRKI